MAMVLSNSMLFGVALPTYCGGAWQGGYPSLEDLIDFCRQAEKLGYSSIWHLEHLTLAPPVYSTTWYEPLITLASIIPAVKKAKIGTSILVLPLRNPAIVAKQVATLDVLSNGRFQLGIGVGWHDKEFEVCGVDMKNRGKRMEEMIKVMKILWTQSPATFMGDIWKFKDVEIEPKPIQKPYPPIIIGAGGYAYKDHHKLERLLRRAASIGDGWIAISFSTPEAIRTSIGYLKRYLAEIGRDVERFIFMHHKFAYLISNDENEARKKVSQVIGLSFEDAKKTHLICDKEDMARRIEEYARAGLTNFNIIPLGFDFKLLEFVANEIAPKYHL